MIANQLNALDWTWIVGFLVVAFVLALIGVVFFLVTPPCCLPWALLGRGAARFLGQGRPLRVFNVVMAVALVASMLPLVLEG